MADLSLVRFDCNGLELFIDQSTGRAYASINATARMCGRNESTVRSLVSARKLELLEAEVQTPGGLQGARLLSSEQVFEVALQYSPDLAKKMGAAGANVYMCGIAGYKVSAIANQSLERLERQFLPTPTAKGLKEFYGLHKLMYGKAYADRWLAAKIKEYHPEYVGAAPQPEEQPKLIVEALLTPTDIAEQLGVTYKTGRANPEWVNKKLQELGYQEKISGQWSATSKAEGLADRRPVETNSRTQKDQLFWSAKVIDILKEHVAA